MQNILRVLQMNSEVTGSWTHTHTPDGLTNMLTQFKIYEKHNFG